MDQVAKAQVTNSRLEKIKDLSHGQTILPSERVTLGMAPNVAPALLDHTPKVKISAKIVD